MKYLIVDDDPSIHDYLNLLLEEYADCTFASSAQEACSLFHSALEKGTPFDTVFMDIMLPEHNGHEVVAKLRQKEEQLGMDRASGFNLVMITSLDDSDNINRAFFDGFATTYIVKPFDRMRVLDELQNARIIKK